MKNLSIILEIYEKKDTLILNNDDDLKFGIETSLFNLPDCVKNKQIR